MRIQQTKGFQPKWKSKSGTRTYFAWRSMRSRCMNPKHPAWKHYGGRGIVVCDAWANSFDQFLNDMGEVPDGFSLDRIDNEKGYSPENCRWATDKEQLNNRRNNRWIEKNGEKKTLSQWAETYGIPMNTLAKRLERMPIEKALQTSLKKPVVHGTRSAYEWHKCRCDSCKSYNNQRAREYRAKKG